MLLGVEHDRLGRQVVRRGADAHVHSREGAAQQVAVRHVVGAVAHVGEREPGEGVDSPTSVGNGGEVREDLARVEVDR